MNGRPISIDFVPFLNHTGRLFPRRLTIGGGDFNNTLLFENNRLLFSPIVSGNFYVGGQGLDGRSPPVPITREILTSIV